MRIRGVEDRKVELTPHNQGILSSLKLASLHVICIASRRPWIEVETEKTKELASKKSVW